MTDALVKANETVAGTAQMLDVALRAAGTLKNARGLLPDSLKTEGEIVAVLLAGAELGLSPMAAIRGLQVVRGKVIISYDTMIALLRRSGYRIEWLECSNVTATLKLTAPDGSTHVETWNEARAKRAGLWGKGTWSQYPDTMLKARCVSSGARAFAGDVLAGVYVEGEIETKPASVTPMRGAVTAAVMRAADDVDLPMDGRLITPDGEIIDAEPVDPAAPPEKLSDCVEGEQLRRWAHKHRDSLSALKNGARTSTIDKVKAAADRCGVDHGIALAWCGLGE